jgi:hypothetical protein
LILPEADSETPETHELLWATDPEISYLLEETSDLSDPESWSPVSGFPTEAVARAQAHAFDVSAANSKFYRVTRLDQQAAEIASSNTADGSFGVGRFSELIIGLDDVTGVDAATIQLSVGTHGAFTLDSAELSSAVGDVLTFDLGGDTALGAYGEAISISLTVADTLGNSDTYTWTFELEVEAEVASNVFVFGSPDAQRSGQRLTGTATVLAARFGGGGPIRMSSGTQDCCSATILMRRIRSARKVGVSATTSRHSLHQATPVVRPCSTPPTAWRWSV